MSLFLHKLTIVFLLLACMGCQTGRVQEHSPPAPLKVLFLGNSYTYYHRMPELFNQLAHRNKKSVSVKSVASGGRRLQDHSRNSRVKKMIEEQHFDWLVMQEQSITPFVHVDQMKAAIRTINGWAHQQKTRSLLFLFWARRYAKNMGIRLNGVPYYQRFGSFADAQNELVHTHKKIANELKVGISPVGVVWQHLHKLVPRLRLWQADGSHPSKAGAYITAMVFYASIFDELPIRHLHSCPLKPSEQQIIASIIRTHVLQRREYWKGSQ